MLEKKKPEKQQQQNRASQLMNMAKQNIYKQAGLAVMAIVVTLVLFFAMTVAWYSNIIHTDSLTFQAKSWDFQFEGNADITGVAVSVAPGDSGYVELSVENTDDEAILVDVTVTRDLFSDDMRKRIYFYVDAAQKKNGESMDRVYINRDDSYGYAVLGGQSLSLSEDYQNAPALKWEWVYDVVGYYFSGSVTPSEDGGYVTTVVNEYLRPLGFTYDADNYDPEGNLSMVGDMTVAQYVEQLMKTDGYVYMNSYDIAYDEVVAEENVTMYKSIMGYYPVNVDQNGNGIWIRFLTKAEVGAENAVDGNLAESAKNAAQSGSAPTEYTARLLLTGEPYTEVEKEVGTLAALTAALNEGEADRVVLTSDITLTDESIIIDSEKAVVLDLNDHTLSVDASADSLVINAQNTFSLVNGTITGTNAAGNTAFIRSLGAAVTLSDIKVSGVQTVVHIGDNTITGADSRVYVTNAEIDTAEEAFFIHGNGSTSERRTSLVIENSTVNSGHVAVMGNGSAGEGGSGGTDIQITKSTVSGKWGAIYHPQVDSVLTVTDSTLTGYTAVAVKGGIVKIHNTTVHGNGETAAPAAHAASGFTDTADGVYVETTYQDRNIEVLISGENTNIVSDKGFAVQMYEPSAANASIVITGGTYSSDVVDFLPESGYSTVEQADGSYYVGASASPVVSE